MNPETRSTEIHLCADFSLFPDDAPFQPNFTLAGFAFEAAAGSSAWFVNESAQERGLQFASAGGRVHLPGPVSAVDLRVGAFAGQFDLEAEDALGNVIGAVTVPHTNSWSDQRLEGTGIAAVAFRGGGNEAAIQKICVDLKLG